MLHRVPRVSLTEDEAGRLEGSGGEWGRRLAEVVRGHLSENPGDAGWVGQVFLLSPPGSAETLRLAQPIEHTRPGAWTQSHRYVRSADLAGEPRTTNQLVQ